MGLNIANIAAKAVNTAGSIVDGLIKDCLLYPAQAYDPTTGEFSGSITPTSFEAVRGTYSLGEIGASRVGAESSIAPTDVKLIASTLQFDAKPENGQKVSMGGHMYLIKNVAEDAVGAMYKLQLRGED